MLISYREWLCKLSPEGGGEIWDNRSNIDVAFGEKGIRSKNVSNTKLNKPVQVKFDPDQLYKGHSEKFKKEKSDEKLPIIAPGYGDNYGLHI